MPESAVAEPPVVETPAAEAKAPTGGITIDLGNLGKKAVKETPPAAVEEKKEEPAKETPAAPVTEKKPSDKEHNMGELRRLREAADAARKTAEEERDSFRKQLEELKTKTPELPEDVKTRLTAVEQLEKDLQESRQRLRQADLARDPEFQAKYNAQITDRIQKMGNAALASGITQEDWKVAVSNWNEEQFAEWSESMTPIQRVKFNAAWTSAVDLYQQQQAELSNAEKTYGELEKQRKADAETQQKDYFSRNEQLAKSVLSDTLKMDGAAEYEDLSTAAEGILMRAARHEIPADEIFKQLAANQVLSRVTVKQKTRIEELQAQLAERDKKITEQDAFIAQHAGAVPRGDAAGKTTSTESNVPIWKQVVVKSS